MADYYGLSKDGFKRKRLPEIKSDIFQRFEDATGVTVEKGSNSILGVLVGGDLVVNGIPLTKHTHGGVETGGGTTGTPQ